MAILRLSRQSTRTLGTPEDGLRFFSLIQIMAADSTGSRELEGLQPPTASISEIVEGELADAGDASNVRSLGGVLGAAIPNSGTLEQCYNHETNDSITDA